VKKVIKSPLLSKKVHYFIQKVQFFCKSPLFHQKAVADPEGFLGFQPKTPLRSEDLIEDALKLKFLEVSTTPLFRISGTSLPDQRG